MSDVVKGKKSQLNRNQEWMSFINDLTLFFPFLFEHLTLRLLSSFSIFENVRTCPRKTKPRFSLEQRVEHVISSFVYNRKKMIEKIGKYCVCVFLFEQKNRLID